MFEKIKEEVNILDGISRYISLDMVSSGTDTYEPEDKTCPLCSHRDCFKVKDNGDEQYWSCFSECGVTGSDIIGFVEKMFKLTPKDAALKIAEDFGLNIKHAKVDPKIEVFQVAMNYYQMCLLEATIKKPDPCLNNMTPLNYQLEMRGHTIETLKSLYVGWSDGGLLPHLQSLGYDDEFLKTTGLINKTGKWDYLPGKSFIYPHIVDGKTVGFSFKCMSDSDKKKAYSFKKANYLREFIAYNQDSVKRGDVVIVVEGENDVASVLDTGWESGVVGTLGSLEKKQISWLSSLGKSKNVITIFDSDDAGNKYRATLNKKRHCFTTLTHIAVPEEYNDIDNFIQKNNWTMSQIIAEFGVAVPVSNEVSAKESIKNLNGGDPSIFDETSESTVDGVSPEDSISSDSNRVFADEGCYWKPKMIKEEERAVPISNFVIDLKNVFNKNGELTRQIVIKTKNGKRSDLVFVNSSDKVSMKQFRTLLANAADGSFYGGDLDLIHMWEYVYDNSKPGMVWVADTVGVCQKQKGWLFDDCFIDRNGVLYEPDNEGIMWLGSSKKGIKCRSLNADDINSEGMDIPRLSRDMDPDERAELLEGLVRNLSTNLGNPGMALTMIGWVWANVYSDEIFKKRRFFPFLYLWGRHGKGKTNLVKWMLALLGMEDCGYATVSNLRSTVGFERKAAFYASLPMAIDEMRADKHTAQHYGKFRGWYNRSSRTMGTKEAMDVRTVPVRSNFLFCGQDIFTDSAAKERCITLQIPSNGRETEHSYRWIESRVLDLSNIGYGWILESIADGHEGVMQEIEEVDALLKDTCSSARTRFQFAIAGSFGRRLRDKFIPDYDYEGWMRDMSGAEADDIKENDILFNFFERVEGLCVGDRPLLTGEHISVEDKKMHVWFVEVLNIVKERSRSAEASQEPFSKGALQAAIKDESWFISMGRARLGMKGTQRRVLTLALDDGNTPEVLQRIAASIDQTYTVP